MDIHIQFSPNLVESKPRNPIGCWILSNPIPGLAIVNQTAFNQCCKAIFVTADIWQREQSFKYLHNAESQITHSEKRTQSPL